MDENISSIRVAEKRQSDSQLEFFYAKQDLLKTLKDRNCDGSLL